MVGSVVVWPDQNAQEEFGDIDAVPIVMALSRTQDGLFLGADFEVEAVFNTIVLDHEHIGDGQSLGGATVGIAHPNVAFQHDLIHYVNDLSVGIYGVADPCSLAFIQDDICRLDGYGIRLLPIAKHFKALLYCPVILDFLLPDKLGALLHRDGGLTRAWPGDEVDVSAIFADLATVKLGQRCLVPETAFLLASSA